MTTNVKSISYSVIQVKGTHAYYFENDHCCLGLRLVMLRLRELVRRSPVGPCTDVSTLLYSSKKEREHLFFIVRVAFACLRYTPTAGCRSNLKDDNISRHPHLLLSCFVA